MNAAHRKTNAVLAAHIALFMVSWQDGVVQDNLPEVSDRQRILLFYKALQWDAAQPFFARHIQGLVMVFNLMDVVESYIKAVEPNFLPERASIKLGLQ